MSLKYIALGLTYIIEGITYLLYGLLSIPFPSFINSQCQRTKWNKWFTFLGTIQTKIYNLNHNTCTK